MKINGTRTFAELFAYDGCHKIYLIERKEDENEAIEDEYDLFPISELEKKWNESCDLRFISSWSLTTQFVEQFEDASFAI